MFSHTLPRIFSQFIVSPIHRNPFLYKIFVDVLTIVLCDIYAIFTLTRSVEEKRKLIFGLKLSQQIMCFGLKIVMMKEET